MQSETLFYAEEILDRSHLIRKDEAQIAMFLEADNVEYIIHWKGKHLFYNHDQDVAAYFGNSEFRTLAESHETLFVGLRDNRPVFGIDISSFPESDLTEIEGQALFEELRTHAGRLRNEHATLLAYVKGMFTWHQNHLFCGRCGSPTKSTSAGHERKCIDESCGALHFPRIDPAVIVLIEHQFEDGINRCLLARHKRSGPGRYSTLAGFVEPGETLEMTVKREMYEEAGVTVKNVKYIASQPWPFPSSIMLGFFAEAENHELTLDKDELKEAHWFTADELKKRSESGEMMLSGIDSIANYLIRHWMAKEGIQV